MLALFLTLPFSHSQNIPLIFKSCWISKGSFWTEEVDALFTWTGAYVRGKKMVNSLKKLCGEKIIRNLKNLQAGKILTILSISCQRYSLKFVISKYFARQQTHLLLDTFKLIFTSFFFQVLCHTIVNIQGHSITCGSSYIERKVYHCIPCYQPWIQKENVFLTFPRCSFI